MTAPPITDALREHARRNPGQWTYAVDPALEADGSVPQEGIVGAWKVDENGEIDENFRPNEKYRPTPVARKWPEPTDLLDAITQWAATGWAAPAQVAQILADATLYAYAGADDAFVMVLGPDGQPQIHLFSDPAHAPEGEDLRQTTLEEIREFAEPTTFVVINEGSPGQYVLSADHLLPESSADSEVSGDSHEGAGA